MHKVGSRYLFSYPRSLVPKGKGQFNSYKEGTCQDGWQSKEIQDLKCIC